MIYIECDADEVLINELGFNRKQFIHLRGKYRISKRLKESKNSIGLIEHDFGRSDPNYLRECKLIDQSKSNHIDIYFHKDSRNKLIVLYNDLEDWIIKASKAHGVDLSQFGLVDDRDKMHKSMPGKLANFRKLISHLVQKQIPEFKYLQEKLRGN